MKQQLTDKVLQALSDMLRGYKGIEKAELFGSRARGDNTERSDYDVAVYGALSASEQARLACACREDLPTLHKIDLIFMTDDLEPKFLESIHREGIIFYDAKNSDEAN